jgi:hypothetical protein
VSYGVSAVFGGHVHAYERSRPVFNNSVLPPGRGSMTHFNIGDGGADLYTGWLSPQPAWSAFRDAVYGHGQLRLLNATHAAWTWRQHSGAAADSVTLLNAAFEYGRGAATSVA